MDDILETIIQNRNNQECDVKSEASKRQVSERSKKPTKKSKEVVRVVTSSEEEKTEQIQELRAILAESFKSIAAKIGKRLAYKTAPYRIWDRK